MATYRFPRMLTLLAWEAELRHGPTQPNGPGPRPLRTIS